MLMHFLQNVATQVRSLVREGKALHVSDKTADELELVAGLFTEPVTCIAETASARAQRERELVTGEFARDVPNVMERREVTPADIAWAWLKLSACELTKEPGKLTHWWEAELWPKMRRAAECAELAMIAGRMGVPEGRSIEIDGQEVRLCSPVNPHEGTRDGARAAWGHVVQASEMQQRNSLAAQLFHGKPETWQSWQGLRDRYRRELEAL